MPLNIKLAKAEIISIIQSTYEGHTHSENTPEADGDEGNVKVTIEPNKQNSYTPAVNDLVDSIVQGVYEKVKEDLDAIKDEISSMITVYNSHTHSNGNQGSPTGPPTGSMS